VVAKKKVVKTLVVTGEVTSVSVKGRGPNSGDVVFTLPSHAFQITGPPKPGIPGGYEPYVFTAMANLVIAAYYGGDKVTVEYVKVVGVTDEPISIKAG